MKTPSCWLVAAAVITLRTCTAAPSGNVVLEYQAMRVELATADGSLNLLDKETGVGWTFGPAVVARQDGIDVSLRPSGDIQRWPNALHYRTTDGE